MSVRISKPERPIDLRGLEQFASVSCYYIINETVRDGESKHESNCYFCAS